VVSPLAAGLLQRAVLMSGACVATPLAAAEAKGRAVADKLGCAAAPDVPACLRTKPAAEVMATLDPMDTGTDTLGRMSYDGVIDGYLLPEAPRALIAARRHNAVPVLVGTTSAENGRGAPRITTAAEYEAAVRAYMLASGLPASVADRALAAYPVTDYATPRDAYVALTSDVKFACQARTDARALAAAQAAPVYRYWFDHAPERGGASASYFGAFHGLELPFLFGVLEFGLGAVRYRPGPNDLAVSVAMQGYWARFAATGDPNGDGAPAWPAYERPAEPYLRLAAPPMPGTAVRGAQCDFWDGLMGR
jgi:para-nitrobenzyl esterase